MPEKKAILIIADEGDLNTENAAIQKFIKRSATVTDFKGEDITAEVMSIDGCLLTEVSSLSDVISSGALFVFVNMGNPTNSELESAITIAMETADQRTLLVYATQENIYFYGFGIKRGARADRTAFSKDIVPTICYIADLPLPDGVMGAVLYQILKDRNMKLNEIKKLKDALEGMEAGMERASRKPWEKFHCA